MAVATVRIEVGVRELKNNLSRFLERVKNGDEVIVTDRGEPVARLTSLDPPSERLAELIASGLVRPPTNPVRHPHPPPIKAKGSVSDLVAEQRR
jgi:prevent-host-death family protein